MRIFNLTPLNRPLDDGHVLVANFDAELCDGVIARLTLVKSNQGDADLIWSTKSPRGPVIRVNRDARVRMATAVRAELATFAASLADAA